MKPPIAYGLAAREHAPGYGVIAVTSISGMRVYGRDERGVAIQISANKVYGRFTSREEATEACRAIERIEQQWSAPLDGAQRQLDAIKRNMERDISQALSRVQAHRVDLL